MLGVADQKARSWSSLQRPITGGPARRELLRLAQKRPEAQIANHVTTYEVRASHCEGDRPREIAVGRQAGCLLRSSRRFCTSRDAAPTMPRDRSPPRPSFSAKSYAHFVNTPRRTGHALPSNAREAVREVRYGALRDQTPIARDCGGIRPARSRNLDPMMSPISPGTCSKEKGATEGGLEPGEAIAMASHRRTVGGDHGVTGASRASPPRHARRGVGPARGSRPNREAALRFRGIAISSHSSVGMTPGDRASRTQAGGVRRASVARGRAFRARRCAASPQS